MALNKYVFYQDKAWVGICHSKIWEQVKYEKEITPIRMSILECTQQYIDCLFDVLAQDIRTFSDMIIDEMDNDKHCLYSN